VLYIYAHLVHACLFNYLCKGRLKPLFQVVSVNSLSTSGLSLTVEGL